MLILSTSQQLLEPALALLISGMMLLDQIPSSLDQLSLVDSVQAEKPPGSFGITKGAGLNISFVTDQTSAQFGTGISNLFDVQSKVVTFGIDANNYISLAFDGGGVVQLQGFSSAEAIAMTNTFGNTAGANTGNFGTEFVIPTFS